MEFTQKTLENEEESLLLAMELCNQGIVPYTIKTVVELKLLEIIAEAGPSRTHLSPKELASKAAPNNPDASSKIDRLLRFLASYSVTTCKLVKDENGKEIRVYGIGEVGKRYIKDEDGFSIASMAFFDGHDNSGVIWSHLTTYILEGGATPYERTYGTSFFENITKTESKLTQFNDSMFNQTLVIMKKILESYDGFKSQRNGDVLVDVGGGLGANLALILSKFPHLKGINFDLPEVVKEAPQINGIEHVGGDMFVEIPQGQTIFMKWIIHDWSDEKCVEILKNCKKAIPKTGKVIIVERILPQEISTTCIATKNALRSDIGMMCFTNGGKERTKEGFDVLAMEAGFKLPNIVYGAYSHWIIELSQD